MTCLESATGRGRGWLCDNIRCWLFRNMIGLGRAFHVFGPEAVLIQTFRFAWWICLATWIGAGELGRFSRVDLDQGLSHKSVYGIHQDRVGYMWFATQNGLNRYDGVRFKVYHQQPGNESSLSEDNINSMVEDDLGNLWIGSWGGGLNRFDPRTETSVRFSHNPQDPTTLSSNYVQSLHQGRNGVLWVGTLDAGLNRLDLKTSEILRYLPNPKDPSALNHPRVWSVYEQDDGMVWVATEQGLSLLDPNRGKFRPIEARNGSVDLNHLPVRALLPSGENRLWLGTADGLHSLDLKTLELTSYPTVNGRGAGLGGVVVNVLHESSDGDLWIGTVYKGLLCMDSHSGSVRTYEYDPRDGYSLSGNDVRALYSDRSGNLWIGTRGSGLSKLDLKPGKFRTYSHKPDDPNSLPFGDIRALTTDNQGALWIGTLSSGLSRLDRSSERYTHFRHDPANQRTLSHNNITALAFDDEERLLVGTFQGLNRLEHDGRSFTRFFPEPGNERSIAHERISAILTDSASRVWIGTQRGVSQFDGKSFRNFKNDPKQPESVGPGRVYTLYEDLDRNLWVGVGHAGLFRFREKKEDFEAYHLRDDAPPGLRNNSVVTLCDSGTALWIGTLGGGLISLAPDRKHFASYNTQDGLLNNTIYGILPGGPDTLWMSTNKGLCRFTISRQSFRCYGVFDGLQSTQFSLGSYYRSPAGELFFGGIEGVNAFKPEEVQDHYYIPSVVISSFKVDAVETHRDLANGAEVVIEPPKQTVEFDFAALDYTHPDKNLYMYKLEGVDTEWVNAEIRTSALYHTLEPGQYTFNVKGSNHDGIWNTAGTSLKVIVTSSFWKTWFYYILYFALFVGLVVGGFSIHKYRQLNRTRLAALQRSEQLAVEANRTKSAFLAHVSHELRTPLNAIIGFTELIEEDLSDYDPSHFRPAQCIEDLAKIKSSAYLQLAQVNNLLELTRLESGKTELYIELFDVRTMVNGVLHHIQPMLKKTGNTLEVRFLPDEIGEMTADFMKVQGILVNLLTNANKFTKEGLITLSVMRTQERGESMINFQITDTGVGMSTDQINNIFDGFSLADATSDHQMSGLGLYITRHFSQLMGGRIGVESQLSKGSTFSVKLPVSVPNQGAAKS